MKTPILFLTAVFVFCSTYAQNKSDISKYTSQKPQYGFIENKGQIYDQNYKANPDVKYLLCLGNGMNVQLKANSFSYDTYKTEIKDKKGDIIADKMRLNDVLEKDITYYFHRVDVELVGSNPTPQITAEKTSSDYLNYYNAVTPESGATKVRHFKKITYKDIYPGIDMVFMAQAVSSRPVEYTFVIHPGADARQIKLRYIGAKQTQLAGNKINVDVTYGRFTESIPASWVKETNKKLNIAYRNINKDTYGFDVPLYNQNQTLIIDPNPYLDWGTYYGGGDTDNGYGISCDGSGNVFITGWTGSTSGIATAGAHQTSLGGDYDVFVVKFSNSGVRQWSTYYGGSESDIGLSISCDGSENVFITGYTNSTSGIATFGAYQIINGGDVDAFVVKFSSSGVRQWGTYYGGSYGDQGYGISCDGSGDVLIIGDTKSSSGIATAGAYQTTIGSGNGDAFVVKFNNTGVRQWGTYYGGSGYDHGSGISCDGSINVFITGWTGSTSGIATAGAHQTTLGGIADAFVVKFSNSGLCQWGTYYGGSELDNGRGISSDVSGNVIIIGDTKSISGIATAGAHQTTYEGGSSLGDSFVIKFDNNGVRQWGTYYGGSEDDLCYGISCDVSGNIFITGSTKSISGIATSGAHQTTYGGGYNNGDAFVVKFNSSGVRQWGTYYGGILDDYGLGITCDGSGDVLLTGMAGSTSGIATAGAYQTINGGFWDVFVAKFLSSSNSIESYENSDVFFVYPNPFTNELIIEVKNNKKIIYFEIFNSIGKAVYKSNLQKKTVVQTTNFASGGYIIKFEHGRAYEFKKIIKE